MKISSIHLEKFKRFESLDFEVRNGLTQDIAEQFLVLGDNGTGKTTILQAIALTLSLVSRVTRDTETFNWVGWVPGRYKRWGAPVVELKVHFSEDEILATQKVFKRWNDSLHRSEELYIEPGDSKEVILRLEGERLSTALKPERYQFMGRAYARELINKRDYEASQFFEKLPGIFWFDQFRTVASSQPYDENDDSTLGRISYFQEVSQLREILNSWLLASFTQDTLVPRINYLHELEKLYQQMFPDRRFNGAEPMYQKNLPTPTGNYFTINDGKHNYDIEEMSSGEQSIFPILFHFVRQQIKHSIVLIDEIDLNLHPPLAQKFLSILPKIGPDCQFFYTTHSEAISDIVSPEQIYRLPGGKLCL